MNLSEQEQAILESLVSEDTKNTHYAHDIKISKKIVGLIVCDRNFLVQSIDLIKPEFFEDESHRLIYTVVFNYFKQYNSMPTKAIIINEIKAKRGNDANLLDYLGELEAVIYGYVDGQEGRDYLLDKITEFAKEQAVKVGVSKTIELVKSRGKDRYTKIAEIWRSALTVDKNHELGLDYFKDIEDRYDKMMGQREEVREISFSSGFPEQIFPNGQKSRGIDGLLTTGGLSRGEIGAFVGLSGSGKSIALINAAVTNLLRGKKVCYLTLEMGEDKIAKRFDALLSEQPFHSLLDKRSIVIDAIKSHVRHEIDQGRLRIKHYPGGTANVDTFRAYMSQVNLHDKFNPDMIVVDYVGEMKDLPGMQTYESRQMLVRDLRTLAVEENVCVLTAFQANRKGREIQEFEGSIDDDALADAFGQARPMDALWSINKVEGSNIGWIYIMKHRDGISKAKIFYEMDTNILKMREITREEFNNKKAQHKKAESDQAARMANEAIPVIT